MENTLLTTLSLIEFGFLAEPGSDQQNSQEE
jgi:hypothetical protein